MGGGIRLRLSRKPCRTRLVTLRPPSLAAPDLAAAPQGPAQGAERPPAGPPATVAGYTALRQGNNPHSGRLAGKNIRAQLRAAFPGHCIAVHSPRRGQLTVAWQDGPTVDDVRAIVAIYQRSPPADRPEGADQHTAWTNAFGGVDLLQLTRSLSASLVDQAIEIAFARHATALVGVDRPLADDFFHGRLIFTAIPSIEREGGGVADLQSLVRTVAHEIRL